MSGMGTAALVLSTGITNFSGIARAQTINPVVTENQQLGSGGWKIGLPGYRVADDTTGQIKGYASAASVNKGETITFHVTVNPAQTYTMDIYRMGWYNGSGGRHLQKVGSLDGVRQPKCTANATTGLVSCNWSRRATR